MQHANRTLHVSEPHTLSITLPQVMGHSSDEAMESVIKHLRDGLVLGQAALACIHDSLEVVGGRAVFNQVGHDVLRPSAT